SSIRMPTAISTATRPRPWRSSSAPGAPRRAGAVRPHRDCTVTDDPRSPAEGEPMTSTDNPADVSELDVRGMRKPDKHPTIFATYADLPVGGAFVLINDHDPKHLHDEFEADHAGSYDWEYLNREMRDWRIKITKLSSTPLPHVLTDTSSMPADTADAAGAIWKLEARERDLDSNIIALQPNESIDSHTGPDLDVLMHVL